MLYGGLMFSLLDSNINRIYRPILSLSWHGTMFLLRHLPFRGVSKISGGDTLRKSTKLKNHVWSTFSNNSYVSASEADIVNSCLQKVISRQYSNKASEKAEVVGTVNDGEDSAMTTEEMFEEIANGDPQVLRKLKLLQFEIEVLRQSNQNVPSKMKKAHWEYLIELKTVTARKRYLIFLFKNEMRNLNDKKKKLKRKEDYLKTKDENPIDEFTYNLSNQTLFLRIYQKALTRSLFTRCLLNEDIAQHFVFDCSFQEYMDQYNTRLCAVQLLYCLHLNLTHDYPSFIRLCNLNKDYELSKLLPNYLRNVQKDIFPWEIHEESYLDYYPKDKLVYLTPHCSEPLMKLTPGDVYIIGAFVDKGYSVKGSLARAKKHNLRMAKFPLDEHIKWKQGTKSLPLNLVLKIMLDMKKTQNWRLALKNVPSRHYDALDYELNFRDPQDLLV